METTIADNIENLKTLSIDQLRIRYRQLFGEEHTTRRRDVMMRRMAWRMQSLAEGGLSERARQRALELAADADIRILIPRGSRDGAGKRQSGSTRDGRLPTVGTVLRRRYQDRTIEVVTLDEGFQHDGVRYESLSAIASKVTGTRWNGFLFFQLTPRRGNSRKRGRP
jgi:hypothetical protein